MTRYIKQPKNDTTFVVVQDDREKRPWKLPYETEVTRLKVGDYTIKGCEDLIAIEKKSGLGELLADLSTGYRPTFKRFLEKMAKHPVRCIIVEEQLTDVRVFAALKKIREQSDGKSRLTQRTIFYWVGEIMLTYGVPILFVDKMTLKTVLSEVFRAAYQQARSLK